MTRKKAGRKPLDPDDPSVSVTIRLPSKRFDALARHALAAQESVPAIVRRALLKRIFKPLTP